MSYHFGGPAPSPVGLNWWHNNPWLPLYMAWTVEFHPFQATQADSASINYPSSFFTDNFEIDLDRSGRVRYCPHIQK
ncbi:hypothetical protein C2W62_23260 [Candidatus Entotheonella serta]|nr:hypothetical protein C2W62_23260 [Candidatus Entotheonella serta]